MLLPLLYFEATEAVLLYLVSGVALKVETSRWLSSGKLVAPKEDNIHLPNFLRDSVPAEHKDGIDMARELLRRSHVLIVCGDEVDEAVKNDIAVAQRLGITATTLDGILKIRGQGQGESMT